MVQHESVVVRIGVREVDGKVTYAIVVRNVSDQAADGLGGPGLLVDIAVYGSCRVEVVLPAELVTSSYDDV